MDYDQLVGIMNRFVDESPLNRVEELGLRRIYDEPLVGVAMARDPLFLKLQDPAVVGRNHFLPTNWLPGAQSVIAYFLPFSARVREANRKPGLPAAEWLYGRTEGEEFNNALRLHVVEAVKGSGAEAVAPALDSRFAIQQRRTSNWSERHVAYIAGLGTFSLGRSLISAKGCAGRYGSVVVSLELNPSPRRYAKMDEYCNMCGDCIKRCPVGAIKARGKDLDLCAAYMQEKIKKRFAPRYGCGKCQTAVSCEHSIPETGE